MCQRELEGWDLDELFARAGRGEHCDNVIAKALQSKIEAMHVVIVRRVAFALRPVMSFSIRVYWKACLMRS